MHTRAFFAKCRTKAYVSNGHKAPFLYRHSNEQYYSHGMEIQHKAFGQFIGSLPYVPKDPTNQKRSHKDLMKQNLIKHYLRLSVLLIKQEYCSHLNKTTISKLGSPRKI